MVHRLATAAAVAMALVCPASAEPSVRRLAILVTSDSATPREEVRPVRIPRGARVVGMSVIIDGQTSVARDLQPDVAAARYESLLESYRDPALLEHVVSHDDHDEMRLRVFPVSMTQPAHVELVVEAPAEREWMTDDTVARHVSPQRSLVALEPPARAGGRVPVVTICGFGGRPIVSGDLDKTTIRRYMRRQLPRVKGCYDRALLRDATIAGRVTLHFRIHGDGRTHAATVDGDVADESLRACIREELSRFEFPVVPTLAGAIEVNYPLDLRAD